MAFEHQAETRRKQNVAVLGAFAPIDENFAGIEVDIADLDVDEFVHAYSGIEEQFDPATLLPRARFRPADGGPCHRQSPYRLDGGISALAAAPSSWTASRSGCVCRRHRHRLDPRDW